MIDYSFVWVIRFTIITVMLSARPVLSNLLSLSKVVLILTMGCLLSKANTVLIDADNSGGVLCSVAAPCGSVTVTGTSTLHVLITMTSPFGVFGNDDTFGFNVSGPQTGVTITDFSNPNFNASGGSGNEDGWGSYTFRVSGPGGSGAVSTLSFDVTRSGTPFTSPANIEAGGSGANGSTVFGLHVRNNSTGFTGYAGTGDPLPPGVPEPSTFVMLGGALGVATLLKLRLVRPKIS